ncbi:MAG: cupin domain-containing protein [Bryobacterales bacterium]|nr:cupin domain-containing protein [Bryobacterales bacterium]
MQVQRWNQTEVEQMNGSIGRQVLHGSNITVSRLILKKGGVVPVHHHINEQITTLLEGRLMFLMDGKEVLLEAGESLVIPPNVPHRVDVLEDSIALDVFAPVREDWIRGDDAYLRK